MSGQSYQSDDIFLLNLNLSWLDVPQHQVPLASDVTLSGTVRAAPYNSRSAFCASIQIRVRCQFAQQGA